MGETKIPLNVDSDRISHFMEHGYRYDLDEFITHEEVILAMAADIKTLRGLLSEVLNDE